MSVTIITPTYRRSEKVLRRCFQSIESQTYRQWHHLVVIDDCDHKAHLSEDLIKDYRSDRRSFICLEKNTNNYGNTPRHIAIQMVKTDYIVFVDDDNIIFPDYLETMVKSLQDQPEASVGICRIIHMGPLPQRLCPPPKIIDGQPPVLQNVDTLQMIVRAEVMKKEGWEVDKGYMADGYTIEKLCGKYRTIFIGDILGVHM